MAVSKKILDFSKLGCAGCSDGQQAGGLPKDNGVHAAAVGQAGSESPGKQRYAAEVVIQ